MEIDYKLFRQLAAHDPEDICRRVSCGYEEDKTCYLLDYWGQKYRINVSDNNIAVSGDNAMTVGLFRSIFLVNYLMQSEGDVPDQKWISEKDLKGGATFFRGPHMIPTTIIASCYGNDLEAFARKCEQLGGKPTDLGDRSYCFALTERLPVAVLYWAGDDEFGPEAKILFDGAACRGLALDTVYALAVDICEEVGQVLKEGD